MKVLPAHAARCCPARSLPLPGQSGLRAAARAVGGLLLCWLLLAGQAAAQSAGGQGASHIDGVYWQIDAANRIEVAAQLHLELPSGMREALQQGIPMVFVAKARLSSRRWWLFESTDAQSYQYWRLSYQPLTQVWRVHISYKTGEGKGRIQEDMSRNYATFAQALHAIEFSAPLAVASLPELSRGRNYAAEYSFALDLQQLPAPMRYQAAEMSDWHIRLADRQTIRFP